jgi:hypothetical protein
MILTSINVVQPNACGFITAAELGHLRKSCIKISTGSKQLDAALKGSTPSPPTPNYADTTM